MNTNSFISGFIKAANSSGLPEENIVDFIKSAYADNLSEQDLAKIRIALRRAGYSPGYNDPSGFTSSNYNQAILNARDASLGQEPHNQGILSGISHSIPGALLGGTAGHLTGGFLNRPGKSTILNALRRKLPVSLGLGGAIAGGLLTGLPAYEAKKQNVSSFQKLNDPENIERISRALQADKTLLAS